MTYAFQTEDLVKGFGTTTALAGLNLRARWGTVLGVLGPNGAGKTTLIRVLATLLRADSGRALVGGMDVATEAAHVRRMIGLTGQYAAVDEDLTGTENLRLLGQLLDLTAAQARARAAALLEQFGLSDAAMRRVRTYSGGMRRRLDLAASLVGRPRIVFLDEPTTGLDPGKREDLWRTIRSLAADGCTVLLTTQYLEEADALADEITVIDHGSVIAHDTPAGLKHLVGGQIAVIQPRDPTMTEVAADTVQHLTGHAPDRTGRGVLTVPVNGEDEFARIVHHLRAADVEVSELALRLPTLDEVFLTLTGGSARAHTESKAGTAP
ncbi:ATP-binding cassette domain-containing protein [Pseudactinotalea sp. Z1732]|uniref:ATP-binding cassette domain-containing protein n=1 Tax=Micrococcales TaxID=85006 RepID=UPI003C7B6862